MKLKGLPANEVSRKIFILLANHYWSTFVPREEFRHVDIINVGRIGG